MNENSSRRLVWPRIVPSNVVDGWYMTGRTYQQLMRDYLMTHEIVFDSARVEDGVQITARLVPKGEGK